MAAFSSNVPFSLTLVTPERKLLAAAPIEEAFVPGFLGEMNVLPGHAPLMTTLSVGILRYRLKGESTVHYVSVSSGYCQVNPEGVTVLAETAENPEDIDIERARNAYAESVQRLRSAEIGVDLLQEFQDRAARAVVRQEVAAKAPTGIAR